MGEVIGLLCLYVICTTGIYATVIIVCLCSLHWLTDILLCRLHLQGEVQQNENVVISLLLQHGRNNYQTSNHWRRTKCHSLWPWYADWDMLTCSMFTQADGWPFLCNYIGSYY